MIEGNLMIVETLLSMEHDSFFLTNNNHYSIMKHFFLACLMGIATFGQVSAQTEPSLDDIQSQMEQMQQQMMQMFGIDSSQVFTMPFEGMDTTFFFKSDTSFLGNGFGGFFRSNPLGLDENGDMDMNQMFRSFGDLIEMFDGMEGMDGFSTYPPADDGGMYEGEEDLLPEERLRQEENGSTKPKKRKKKRKTVKI